MRHLTSTDAANLMFALIQKLREGTDTGNKFTLANAATLMGVIKNPGVLQSDLLRDVGGVQSSSLTRHLDTLEGIDRARDAVKAPLIARVKNTKYRNSNDVVLTPEGEAFAKEFADYFNKLLSKS